MAASSTFDLTQDPTQFLVVAFDTDIACERDHFSSLCIVSRTEYRGWQELYDLKENFPLRFPSLHDEELTVMVFQELWEKMQVFTQPADILVIHRMFGKTQNQFGGNVFHDVLEPSYEQHRKRLVEGDTEYERV